jgi:hypothetical protein
MIGLPIKPSSLQFQVEGELLKNAVLHLQLRMSRRSRASALPVVANGAGDPLAMLTKVIVEKIA